MKLLLNIFTVGIICLPLSTMAQDSGEKKDRAFRIEIEPTAFLSKGYSILGSYGVTKDRNLSVGLYTLGLEMPDFLKTQLFDGIDEADHLRMTFELAATVRYKIPLFKNVESNPYVGLFFGYQSYRHTDVITTLPITTISNLFLTPQVGYELYVFRQMLYLNPSFRVVYEFGKKSDYNNPLDANDAGPTIKDWLWLPSIAIGVRI